MCSYERKTEKVCFCFHVCKCIAMSTPCLCTHVYTPIHLYVCVYVCTWYCMSVFNVVHTHTDEVTSCFPWLQKALKVAFKTFGGHIVMRVATTAAGLRERERERERERMLKELVASWEVRHPVTRHSYCRRNCAWDKLLIVTSSILLTKSAFYFRNCDWLLFKIVIPFQQDWDLWHTLFNKIHCSREHSLTS